MEGYRVRLRVVEEYEVALLAESAEDAKARAEADVRGGGEFEHRGQLAGGGRLGRGAGRRAVPGSRIEGPGRLRPRAL